MTRRANAHLVALLLVSIGGLILPQLGSASSGGASPSGGTPPGGTQPGTRGATGVVRPGNQTATASGNGVTVSARVSAMLRNQLRFSGTVSRAARGHIVEIERRGRQTGWTWAGTTHGRVRRDGSFTAVWPANHIGRFAIRAVVLATRSPRVASSSPPLTVTVYKPAVATWYGPGFYGQMTACGEKLTRHTLGVANRTLPCGTPVGLYYRGRTIVVPVIDRGPYANGADWDLTGATARALRMDGTATIGAVSLPR